MLTAHPWAKRHLSYFLKLIAHLKWCSSQFQFGGKLDFCSIIMSLELIDHFNDEAGLQTDHLGNKREEKMIFRCPRRPTPLCHSIGTFLKLINGRNLVSCCCQLDWQFHLIPKDWANNMTSQNHDVTKGDTKKKLFCSFIFLMKFWSRRGSSTTNSELASCCYFLNVQSILIGLNRIIIKGKLFWSYFPS